MVANAQRAPESTSNEEEVVDLAAEDIVSEEGGPKQAKTLTDRKLDLEAGERLEREEVVNLVREYDQANGTKLLSTHEKTVFEGSEKFGDDYMYSNGFVKRAAKVAPGSLLELSDDNAVALDAALALGTGLQEKFEGLKENNVEKAMEAQSRYEQALKDARPDIMVAEYENLEMDYEEVFEGAGENMNERLKAQDERALERLKIMHPRIKEQDIKNVQMQLKFDAHFGLGSEAYQKSLEQLSQEHKTKAESIKAGRTIAENARLQRMATEKTIKTPGIALRDRSEIPSQNAEEVAAIVDAMRNIDPSKIEQGVADSQNREEINAIAREASAPQKQNVEQQRAEAQKRVTELMKKQETAEKRASRYQGFMGMLRSWVNSEDARAARVEFADIEEQLTKAQQELEQMGGSAQEAAVERAAESIQEKLEDLNRLKEGIATQQAVINPEAGIGDVAPPSLVEKSMKNIGELNGAYRQRIDAMTALPSLESATPTEIAAAMTILDNELRSFPNTVDGHSSLTREFLEARLGEYQAAHMKRRGEIESMGRQFEIAQMSNGLSQLRDKVSAFGVFSSGNVEQFLAEPATSVGVRIERDQFIIDQRDGAEAAKAEWETARDNLRQVAEQGNLQQLAGDISTQFEEARKAQERLAILAEKTAIQDIGAVEELTDEFKTDLATAAIVYDNLQQLLNQYDTQFGNVARARLNYDAAYRSVIPKELEGFFPELVNWTDTVLTQ